MTAYIDEIFDSVQGEGPYVGTRQVFVRVQGCPLSCIYCDSKSARERGRTAKIFEQATVRAVPNPVSPTVVIRVVEHLWTASTKHLAVTGGEPLLYPEFLLGLASMGNKPIYIETNALLWRSAQQITHAVDVAACDIKLPEHFSTSDYKSLLRDELHTIKIFCDNNVTTFVKIVIMSDTPSSSLVPPLEGLLKIDPDIPVILQPVTPVEGVLQPSSAQLLELMTLTGEYLNAVRLIPQVHKMLMLK